MAHAQTCEKFNKEKKIIQITITTVYNIFTVPSNKRMT
jgi:hypothetical protein